MLEPREDNVPSGAPAGLVAQTPGRILRAFQDELFASPAFRAWLIVVSRLIPMRHAVEARRFCPGLGYTLATSEENEARLDVVLGLTPQVGEAGGESVKGKDKADEPRGWQSGEWGGWEVSFSPSALFRRINVNLLCVVISATWLLMTRKTTRPCTAPAPVVAKLLPTGLRRTMA